MAHFAKLDNTGTVTQVIVAEQDFINSGQVGDSFLWVQTSYSNSFRKNYAGVGFTYDKTRDAFIPPKPFESWILDEGICLWQPPLPYPEDGGNYRWDEDLFSWELDQ